jgi:hypothetical protein
MAVEFKYAKAAVNFSGIQLQKKMQWLIELFISLY